MLVAILFLLLIITGIIFFIPPFHWAIILALITLISLTVHLSLIKLTTNSKKYSLIGSLLIFVVLSLLALNLFDPVNVVLTISLFVAILIFLK